MKPKYLHDQRGVAMLLELVLVAAVLTLVGLAIYQTDHRPKSVAASQTGATPSSATGLAASAAAISEQASATDVSLSAQADSSISDVTQTDTDAASLEGSSNASF
jgi:hypothetical protein